MEKLLRYLKHPSVIMPTILFSLVGWVYYSYSYYPEKILNAAIAEAKKGDVPSQLRSANLLLVCLNDYRRATDLLEAEDISTLNSFGLYSLCNIKAGKNWARKAAATGNAEGQYRMGLLWHPDDEGDSAGWFKLAAAQGHTKAQVVLGSIYAETDKPESYFWYSLALARAEDEWKANVQAESDKVAKSLTKEQIAEVQKRVKEWQPVSVLSSSAEQAQDAEAVVKAFLASKESQAEGVQETAQSQGHGMADLDGDGKPEIVLVWTTLGPTYWRNSLTIFSQVTGVYSPAATIGLDGAAKFAEIKNGTIIVDQKKYAKKDPICCPTIAVMAEYVWKEGKITDTTKK